jgi:bifunctional DNA-binding transcriptional regulator/antitoxin component of YhaV-PrlF toxin-antitoxin module
VLPKAIRDIHHWGAGTELVVMERNSEVVIKAAKPLAATKLEPPDAPSIYTGKPLIIAAMDLAIQTETGKRR